MNGQNSPTPDPTAAQPTSPEPQLPRQLTSAELFGDARMVTIEHAGQSYRLLITKNDRLILQK